MNARRRLGKGQPESGCATGILAAVRPAAVVILLLAAAGGRSQETLRTGASECSKKKSAGSYQTAGVYSPSSPRHAFDVLSYTLNLDIYQCFLSPYPKSFTASNVVLFRVDSTAAEIALNAVNSSLVIDSVGLNGVSFTHAGDILRVALDRTYSPGETAAVRISYRHNNVSDNAFYASGGFVFTDCEPEGARRWFPCWDRPSDKATLDLTVRIPATAKLGSNGRLEDSSRVADTVTERWVSRDPVSTYLMVISAKVGYNLDIVYWHHLTDPADSIPIRFYWNTGENAASLNNIKSKIVTMTSRYSTLFGEHPFEKNGFATLNNLFAWGGMENQTLTSLCPDCWSENLVSHEFAHQWFGDMITCGTWADIWLNEGFATYCEALWYETTGGYSLYKSDINSDANSYISGNPGWPIHNPSWAESTPGNGTLFNFAITYAKGACVLHMLRYTLGDSLFFDALKAYATDSSDFRLHNAVTADFEAKIEEVTGRELSWFFQEWVHQPNHPVYQNTYNITQLQSGDWMVGFRAAQTQLNPAFFTMPVEIGVSFASGPDTTVRVMNDVNGQVYGFTFNRQPTLVRFDPGNNIVLKQGSTVAGPTLSAPVLSLPADGATDQQPPVPLSWSVAVSAASYRVQVSGDSLFGAIAFEDSTLSDTSADVQPLNSTTRYFWRVRAKNSGGSSAWSGVRSFTTRFAGTASYRMEKLWNMVSVPLVVSDGKTETLFPGAVSAAFAFDGTYVQRDSLELGGGYWLKFDTAQSVNMSGYPLERDTIDVVPGWNLIGSITNSVAAEEVLQSPEGIVESKFFRYAGSYAAADSLRPCQGHWVKAAQAGRLILRTGPPLRSVPARPADR